MPTPYVANNTILKIGTAGIEPATAVGLVETVEIDIGATNMVEISPLGAATKSKLPGTNEPITLTGTLIFDPGDANHDTIVDAKLNKTLVSAGLYFPNTDATEVYSDGYFTDLSSPAVVDGSLKASFTFQGTGAPTYTQVP
jgi:hypothetical protein